MADAMAMAEQQLELSPEETRLFKQVFNIVDRERIGVITGDAALSFFPDKSHLPSETLGEIWQIADADDRGFVTPAGFYALLRLIGHAQAGRPIAAHLASRPGGPLPRFEGINAVDAPVQQPMHTGPIRVPPLPPDKAAQYAALFESSGPQDGNLAGVKAKHIFDRAQLPNQVLGRIWNLADTEQRGHLSCTEFIIAMHLLASYRGGQMRQLPQNLPAGLYEAAARRGISSRPASSSRPSPGGPPLPPPSRQFSGASSLVAARTSSPLAAPRQAASPPSQTNAGEWVITPQEKAHYDTQFAKLDSAGQGWLGGEQAVAFFSSSGLPEEDLATIWDLSDITANGQLSREEFAVALYLIRQQISKKGPLPTVLPPNLIPPSLRSRTSQSAASVSATSPPSSPPKPKSAADDLFGLDEISAPVQVPQSTGGSSSAFTGPSSTAGQTAPAGSSSTFKPFVPTSSFGQSIVSPQSTGVAGGERAAPNVSASSRKDDDLLGDADPEISKRLTNETSDIANLSNQVNVLSTQMKDVQSKREISEKDFSQFNAQKRDYEIRLAQSRSAYEQEVRELKSAQDRNAQNQSEMIKLRNDVSSFEQKLADVRSRRQQATASIESDQREKTQGNERLAQLNRDIAQQTAELDKIGSEVRHQKGLNAILKKQISTAEAEREKNRMELERAHAEHVDSVQEGEQHHRSLQEAPTTMSPSVSPPAPLQANATGGSTNPFFRRSSAARSERNPSQSSATPSISSGPPQQSFDNFFGSTFGQNGTFPTPPAPPTSFHAAQDMSRNLSPGPSELFRPPSALSSDKPASAPGDLPEATSEPPPPPQSRQITSSLLPLTDGAARAASPDSSVGVAAPASRFGDMSGANTPRDTEGLKPLEDHKLERSPLSQTVRAESSSNINAFADPTFSESDPARSGIEEAARQAPLSAVPDIPGSFPGDVTPSIETPPVNHNEASEKIVRDGFNGSNSVLPAASQDDFDSAFASMDTKGKAPQRAPTNAGTTSAKDEFPPIEEFGGDEDSDSEDDKGFGDDFTTPSIQNGSSLKAPTADGAASIDGDARPSLSRGVSDVSELPPVTAQKSPPSYDETTSPGTERARKGSNHFPAEYTGLLPSREDPTHEQHSVPTEANASAANGTSTLKQTEGAFNSIAQGESSTGHADRASAAANTAPSAAIPSKPTPQSQPAVDDFDAAFEGLSDAQAADQKSGDDFFAPNKAGFDEFNPTFDSPAGSKIGTFSDFEPSPSNKTQAAGNTSNGPGNASGGFGGDGAGSSGLLGKAPSNADWDAMFAGLDGPKDTGASFDFPSYTESSSNAPTFPSTASTAGPPAAGSSAGPAPPRRSTSRTSTGPTAGRPTPTRTISSSSRSKPGFSRALSLGPDHDDPILKRLTSMGYSREASLSALEKYDYNLDKAANYLATTG